LTPRTPRTAIRSFAAFADGHRSGVLSEELNIASLIQTLSANLPGILKVKILVEGKQCDTLAGHADLSSFFDVSAINQLGAQLQSTQYHHRFRDGSGVHFREERFWTASKR
jgi:Sporulation and spore germination